MKKVAIIGSAVLAIGVALIGVLLLSKQQFAQMETATPVVSQQSTDKTEETTTELPAKGRYLDYSQDLIATEGYNETILFFYASWCPECRAFDTAIQESSLDKGVQILKVNYDAETELRQKYGVTLQSSFVSINDNGEKITYWQGYGKDKSVSAILENT